MSGDVQPRKRKDKKRKKDDIGNVDEPRFELRGTAAALGEGDVLMHSYQDHGTGGHWCAKIIFFSLLAILVTLIGLIILENRGLSELEANAVESRYSGVLEGWLEDAPDDDHHDEHTLELKNHDDDDHDDHGLEDEGYGDSADDDHDELHDDDKIQDHDHDEDDEIQDLDHEDDEIQYHYHDDDQGDLEDDANDETEDDGDQDGPDNENEQEIQSEEDVEEGGYFSRFFGASNTPKADDLDDDGDNLSQENQDDDDENQNEDDENENEDDENRDEDDDEDLKDDDDQDIYKSDDNMYNNHDQNDDDEHDDEDNDDGYQNVEKKYESRDDERNFFDDDDDESYEKHKEDDDHDEDEEDHEEEDEEVEVERIEKEAPDDEEPISTELPALPEAGDDDEQDKAASPGDDNDDDGPDDDDDFLDADPPPVVERITAPAGKPFQEIDEEDSSERPPDTLEEEEEYEKKQEELRREEQQASNHMWTKLVVGGALLAATFGLLSRVCAPRDSSEREETVSREDSPVIDRRMTLIPEETEPPKTVAPKKPMEVIKPIVQEVTKQIPVIGKTPRVVRQESDEEEALNEPEPEDIEPEIPDKEELYSDEDLEEKQIVEVKKEIPKNMQTAAVQEIPDPDDEMPDDVEIIDDDFEEELQEEEELEEEEISDVDDADLLTRLEAKYGRLPEPERPGQKHKDGGNSVEEWSGEPSDPFWRQQLDSAERELRQGKYTSAVERASAPELSSSARARWIAATALDRAAEAERDNRILSRAITAYIELLKLNDRLSDKKLVEIASRTLDRIKFRGTYLSAEPVYRLLIRRFPDDVTYRNNLTVTYLMANRADLAETLLNDTLLRWPNDRVALAHYGFVQKTLKNKYEEAVEAFEKALEGDTGPACEPRFYYHYGDALLLLGRFKEAHEVHKRAAKHGHFLSPSQRSLYNVPRLKAQPWWKVENTPYVELARALERNWREILKEGQAAKAVYEQEKEGLRERGEWSQLDLFARGREIPGRCARAPVTCAVVKTEKAAVTCSRGQIKFSSMEAGTHVRPHVGPTNCRLRMHLGLSNTKNTYIRVDRETKQWQEGKVLLFDDSFEHEVWHNGTGTRLVLIVDVWHPELTVEEKLQLPPI